MTDLVFLTLKKEDYEDIIYGRTGFELIEESLIKTFKKAVKAGAIILVKETGNAATYRLCLDNNDNFSLTQHT